MLDLVSRIVQVKAGPRGGRYSQPDMKRHRTVVPCADRDAVPVEELGQVVRVRPLEREADDRSPLVGRLRAEDPQTLDAAQDFEGVA